MKINILLDNQNSPMLRNSQSHYFVHIVLAHCFSYCFPMFLNFFFCKWKHHKYIKALANCCFQRICHFQFRYTFVEEGHKKITVYKKWYDKKNGWYKWLWCLWHTDACDTARWVMLMQYIITNNIETNDSQRVNTINYTANIYWIASLRTPVYFPFIPFLTAAPA